jgi:hypothetical protein
MAYALYVPSIGRMHELCDSHYTQHSKDIRLDPNDGSTKKHEVLPNAPIILFRSS